MSDITEAERTLWEQFIHFGEQRLNGKTNLEALLRIMEESTEASAVSAERMTWIWEGKIDNRIKQAIVSYYIRAAENKCG